MFEVELSVTDTCVALQTFTGLECGHLFCSRCWKEYLTAKIMDENKEVTFKLLFVSYCVNAKSGL